jgi:hypothetical protein
MSWLAAWLGYGLGAGAARALFGEEGKNAARAPIRQQTEEEIRADEERFDEEARRLDEEDAAAKRPGARARTSDAGRR